MTEWIAVVAGALLVAIGMLLGRRRRETIAPPSLPERTEVVPESTRVVELEDAAELDEVADEYAVDPQVVRELMDAADADRRSRGR